MELLRGAVILVAALAGVLYLIYRLTRRSSEKPSVLLIKGVLSAVVVLFMVVKLVPALFSSGQAGAFFVPYLAACAVILGILWAPVIGEWVSFHFESVFTGGEEAPESVPFYSIAEAKRKRGQFAEATRLVREQLARFPRDPKGHWLLADIYARDLHDLESAEECLRGFCSTTGLAGDQLAASLNLLADYFLDLAGDLDNARRALQEILDRVPGTPQASRAAARLAHLAGVVTGGKPEQAVFFIPHKVPEGLGLGAAPTARAKSDEELIQKEAEELAGHLEANPQDHTAREKLALLYADHYGDAQTATSQFELLLALEDMPSRQRVHWLNTLADMQIRHNQPQETICRTLERIIALNPEGAAAEQARHRLNLLHLALRVHEKGRTVSLGKTRRDPESDHKETKR